MRGYSSVLALTVVVLATSFAAADDILWHTDADEAWVEVARDRKPLLVYVTKASCPYCVKMTRSTLADPKVAALVNDNFVPLRVELETDAKFVKDMGVKSFPTTLVISADEKLADRIVGYLPTAEAQKRLISAERTASRTRATR